MGDIDFKVISTVENSNKFQKPRFWKEKSVENVVMLGPMAEATLVRVIFVQRKRIDFPLFSITLPSSTPMQRILRNSNHTFPATKLKIQ